MVNRFFPSNRVQIDNLIDWTVKRLEGSQSRQAGARKGGELEAEMAGAINPTGIGAEAALKLFTDTVVPATRSQADEMNLAYIPGAPTKEAIALDFAISAAEIFGGTWETGAGAIHAENQALRWLAELAGWPAEAGGTFVPGGTVGNLSALFAARTEAEFNFPHIAKWRLALSSEAHSSLALAAKVLGVGVCTIEVGSDGRMTAEHLNRAIDGANDVFAVVATGGTTNSGVIDDLSSIADYCAENSIWMHVDGAYGLAAMASPVHRPKFNGIERADSFVVDPHKWLYAPYDCCALVYRDPSRASDAHSQVAPYLDQVDREEWNPCDYAIQLTRRVRGVPFWYSLAVHGTDLYAGAIEQVIDTTLEIAARIDASDYAELVMNPDLSVILARVPGLTDAQIKQWSDGHKLAGSILCLPTTHRGELVLRMCLVNPGTSAEEVMTQFDTLAEV